ncbi:MAG: hypothetical protein ACOY0S_00725 [Patescibacteria group bacterium]
MNKLLIGLVVLALGVVAGWYFLGQGQVQYGANVPTPPVVETATPEIIPPPTATESGSSLEKVVVKYTDSGFSPLSVTVKAGTSVTFINEAAGGMWVASAVHPTHQLLPGFDQLKSVGRGGTYEYTFTKVGTWKYHNHVNPADTGTVVVME